MYPCVGNSCSSRYSETSYSMSSTVPPGYPTPSFSWSTSSIRVVAMSSISYVVNIRFAADRPIGKNVVRCAYISGMVRPKDFPRPTGRPKLPPGGARTAHLSTTVTPKVAERIGHMARSEGYRSRCAYLCALLTKVVEGR